jgi:hypothetical protein
LEIQKLSSQKLTKVSLPGKKADSTEIKDQVTLSKDQPSVGQKIGKFAREAVEFPIGAVGAVAGGATNLLPGTFQGVAKHGGLETGHILQGVALGTAGGVLLDSVLPGGAVIGGLIGGGVGLAASLVRVGMYHATDTDDTIKSNINKTVERYLDDNKHAKDDDVHEGMRDLVESLGVGGARGLSEGIKVGYSEGKGVTSGVIEGLKGAKDVVLGNYPVITSEKEKLTAGKVIGKVVKSPIALASGVIGAVSTLPTGLIHGTKAGIKLAQGDKLDSRDLRDASRSVKLWTKVGTVGLGTAAGALAIGGPWGVGAGLAAGLVGSAILAKLQKTGESDKEIARGVLNAVNYAKSDNEQTGNKVYDGYRDTIESIFVGPLAGLREGFRVGYVGGEAAQDGVFEVVKELVHKSSDQSGNNPSIQSEPTWEEKEKLDSAYPFGIKKEEKPATTETASVEHTTSQEPSVSIPQENTVPQEVPVHEKSSIRKGVEAVGGGIVGLGSTVLHTAAGSVEGAVEGLRDNKFEAKDPEYRHASTGLFTFTNMAALSGISAGAAYLLGAGPVGTAIAAGGGLVGGALLRAFEGSEKTEKLVAKIDLNVDKAVKDNTGDNKPFITGQSLTEGAVVGMKSAAKHSWDIGYEGGKNATGFGIDVGRGIVSGFVELGKDAIGLGPKEGEVK